LSAAPTLRSIQYLRGASALVVALFHAGQTAHLDFRAGAAGVDVFFVISGFVLWTATRRTEVGPLEFLRRRAIRILPLYWLVTLAALLIAATAPGRLPDVNFDLGHLAASMLLVPHINPSGLPFPVLAQGWTLVYEAFFYGVMATALVTPQSWQAPLVFAALLVTITFGHFSPPAYLLLANWLLLEFAFGMVLAQAARGGLLPGKRLAWAMIILALAFFPFTQMIFADDPGNWRVLAWGLPALMLVAGALGLERAKALPSLPGLMALGAASYALYLTNRITIALVAELHLAAPGLILAIALGGSIALGFALYYGVERPLTAALRRNPSGGALL
jgi:exopolysaccharide production protein ExoZ